MQKLFIPLDGGFWCIDVAAKPPTGFWPSDTGSPNYMSVARAYRVALLSISANDSCTICAL